MTTTVANMQHPYPIGTRVYKDFSSFGWFWGTITASTEVGKTNKEGVEYYYDITYSDGDSETLDQNEIQVFIQHAIDNAAEENFTNNKSENQVQDVVVPAIRSLTTSTTATTTTNTSTATEESSDAEIDTDDEDSIDTLSLMDSEYDSSEDHRRPPRRAAVQRQAPSKEESIGRKRPRRSVSYHGRYIEDDAEDAEEEEGEDDDDGRNNVELSPNTNSSKDDNSDDRINDTPRKSPLRQCRVTSRLTHTVVPPSTTKDSTRRNVPDEEEAPTFTSVMTTTKRRRVTLPSKPPSTKISSKSKVGRASKTTTKNDSRNAIPSTRKITSSTGTATTAAGIYDKPPYAGGKDLEVISDIQHMFDDMIVSKILSNDRYTTLLCRFMTELQQRGPIKIATMCSGTESPILALDMIQNAIHDAAITVATYNSQNTGTNRSLYQEAIVNNEPFRQLVASLQQQQQSEATTTNSSSSLLLEKLFPIQHVFSCEIEPFKQAYIERNFSPPILFRDIRELGNDQAYTAYGALVDVPNTPGSVDILIAGTSCVDYSNLNNQKKNMEEKGESGATFYGMLRWIEKAEPPIVIIENVYGAPWNDKVALFEELGYSATFVRLDTKDYYIPHTRQRGYLFAVRNQNGSSNTTKSKTKGQQRHQTEEDPRPSEWADMVTALKRPASASVDDFMLPNDDPRVLRGRARLTAEGTASSDNGSSSGGDMSSSRAGRVDWTKCETRHLTSRSLEELGDKRPLTGWSDSGRTTLPSFCWNEWCNVQVHRIHDLMDINTLRLAKVGIDGTYKTMVWNLSQNVDRDTMVRQASKVRSYLTVYALAYHFPRCFRLYGLPSLNLGKGTNYNELLYCIIMNFKPLTIFCN